VLANAPLIAFVPTVDIGRARSFYNDTLGLPLLEHNDYACVFDAHGLMLRVTVVPDLAPAGHTVLGWRVPDLTGTVRGLVAKGVPFLRYDGMAQEPDGIWTTPGGDKVAWFSDPDGNTLSLTQFA
jgi:catechol 2,3-dioxygenase-like lactoylglutathione lyase family enzyme